MSLKEIAAKQAGNVMTVWARRSRNVLLQIYQEFGGKVPS